MTSSGPGAIAPDYLLIGEILRPHGVHGELKVRVLTDYPERIPEIPVVYIGAGVDVPNPRPAHVESMRMHQGFALVKFREVTDRTPAERLRGLFVMVRIEDAVPLESGEFYAYQAIGLSVRTEAGEDLGHITEILETGANDVYVVHGPRYGELLIPVTADTIISTDIDGGQVVVRLPEGLLPGTALTDDGE